jgi:hypothetical protein
MWETENFRTTTGKLEVIVSVASTELATKDGKMVGGGGRGY